MEKDYKNTLNLPKTDLPMKAGLPNKEPEILSFWDSINLYNLIREALISNNFKNANVMLDWHYSYSGKVVYGNQLGREIGVPTANIWIPKQKLPISGVYAVRCLVDHAKYLGIANMGIRPTVGGTRPVLETHIFDFEKDIYGRRITVQFIEKIREEVKFDSIDLLKSQIKKDIEEAKKILD